MIVTAQAIGIVEMTIKPNPADWAATLLDRIGSCLAVWATLIITMLVRHVHKTRTQRSCFNTENNEIMARLKTLTITAIQST